MLSERFMLIKAFNTLLAGVSYKERQMQNAVLHPASQNQLDNSCLLYDVEKQDNALIEINYALQSGDCLVLKIIASLSKSLFTKNTHAIQIFPFFFNSQRIEYAA